MALSLHEKANTALCWAPEAYLPQRVAVFSFRLQRTQPHQDKNF